MAIVLSQLARGVNLAISERLKKINDYSFIQPFQPEWSVLSSGEYMISRVGRICPDRWYSAIRSPTVDTHPSNPYIARRSPEPSPLKVILRFLSPLVSSAFCSSPSSSQAPLLCIICQVPFLARCTSLPVFPFSQTNLCFVPIRAIYFVSFPH